MALMRTFIDADVEQEQGRRRRFYKFAYCWAILVTPLAMFIAMPLAAVLWAIPGAIVWFVAASFFPAMTHYGMTVLFWIAYYALSCFGIHLLVRKHRSFRSL